jgi:hypothetical protein
MPAALTEVLELAATGDDAVDAAAALAVAEAALARAEARLQALPPAERADAAGRLAEARGLLVWAGRRTRGGDFGGGAWLCVVEAVVIAEGVAPPADARARGL